MKSLRGEKNSSTPTLTLLSVTLSSPVSQSWIIVRNLPVDDRVYFLNVLLEVDSSEPETLREIEGDLKRVGNYFHSLTEAKEAQRKVLNALK